MSFLLLPLESNPKVMNKFLRDLGLPGPWGLSEIMTMDDMDLKFVPQPSFALILCLEVSPLFIDYVQQQEKDLEEMKTMPVDTDTYYLKLAVDQACGKVMAHSDKFEILPYSILKYFLDSKKEITPEERGRKMTASVFVDYVLQQVKEDIEAKLAGNIDMFFIKEAVDKNSGKVAMIHAVVSNLDKFQLLPDSILQNFLDSTKDLTPEERGKKLEDNNAITNCLKSRKEAVRSQLFDFKGDNDLRFIVLVNLDDRIVELDGQRSRPIPHCVTNKDNFLRDALGICRNYVYLNPPHFRHCILSLGFLENSEVS